MLTLMAAVTAFIGVLLVIIGFFQARGGKSGALARLQALESYGSSGVEGPVPLALRKRGSAWTENTLNELDRAGFNLKLHEYVILRAVAGLVLAVFAFALLGVGQVALAVALIAGLVGFMLPRFYVRFRATRQLTKFNKQLEEMITMVSNSLRAGVGLMQSFEFAARELPPPMSTELARLVRDTSVGATMEEALSSLRDRVGSYDLDIVITAILIQRSVGSNLSEVLDRVAHTIRERERMQGEIKTLTAQKKLSGWVIGLLPLGMALLFFTFNPEYMEPLLTTGIGNILLVVAVALDVMGLLMIRRIVNVEL